MQRRSEEWRGAPRPSLYKNVSTTVADARRGETEGLALPLKARIAMMQADAEKWKTQKRHSQLLTKTESGDVVKNPDAIAPTAVDFKKTAAGHTVRTVRATAALSSESEDAEQSTQSTSVRHISDVSTSTSTTDQVLDASHVSDVEPPHRQVTIRSTVPSTSRPDVHSHSSGVPDAGDVDDDGRLYAAVSFPTDRQFPVPVHDGVLYTQLASEQPPLPPPRNRGSDVSGSDSGARCEDVADDSEDDDDDDDEDPAMLYDNLEYGRKGRELPLPRQRQSVTLESDEEKRRPAASDS